MVSNPHTLDYWENTPPMMPYGDGLGDNPYLSDGSFGPYQYPRSALSNIHEAEEATSSQEDCRRRGPQTDREKDGISWTKGLP